MLRTRLQPARLQRCFSTTARACNAGGLPLPNAKGTFDAKPKPAPASSQPKPASASPRPAAAASSRPASASPRPAYSPTSASSPRPAYSPRSDSPRSPSSSAANSRSDTYRRSSSSGTSDVRSSYRDNRPPPHASSRRPQQYGSSSPTSSYQRGPSSYNRSPTSNNRNDGPPRRSSGPSLRASLQSQDIRGPAPLPTTDWGAAQFQLKALPYAPPGIPMRVPLGGGAVKPDGTLSPPRPYRVARRALRRRFPRNASANSPHAAQTLVPSQASKKRLRQTVLVRVGGDANTYSAQALLKNDAKNAKPHLVNAAQVLSNNPNMSNDAKKWLMEKVREMGP